MSGMGARLGGTNLAEARGQGAVPPSGMAMYPWWTGASAGLGAVSRPAVVAAGSGTGISLSSNPLGGGGGGGATRGAGGKTTVDDASNPVSSEESPGSREPKEASFDEGKHHATSQMPASDYLAPYTQLELNQPTASAAYQYPDASYAGMVGPYGAQAMTHLPGLTQYRMPLPLEISEEPVYVNAKQYHGILRRRQSRARAELERKAIKERKPYLHESRHQHAMRRARGTGGRFLNTKKKEEEESGAGAEPGIPPSSSAVVKQPAAVRRHD